MKTISDPVTGATALIFDSMDDIDACLKNLKMMKDSKSNLYVMFPDTTSEEDQKEFMEALQQKYPIGLN